MVIKKKKKKKHCETQDQSFALIKSKKKKAVVFNIARDSILSPTQHRKSWVLQRAKMEDLNCTYCRLLKLWNDLMSSSFPWKVKHHFCFSLLLFTTSYLCSSGQEEQREGVIAATAHLDLPKDGWLPLITNRTTILQEKSVWHTCHSCSLLFYK